MFFALLAFKNSSFVNGYFAIIASSHKISSQSPLFQRRWRTPVRRVINPQSPFGDSSFGKGALKNYA